MAFGNSTAQSHEPMAVHTGIAEDQRKALSDGLAKVCPTPTLFSAKLMVSLECDGCAVP